MFKNPKAVAATNNSNEVLQLGSAAVIEQWVDATLQTALSLDPQSYIPQLFWANKTRPDGRLLGQARQTTITPGVLQTNTIGSALVKLTTSTSSLSSPTQAQQHATIVLAGVTADIGQPFGQHGDLKITLTSGGANSNNNAPLESWLQRLLLQCIDLEQLSIVPGKAAFGLDVTIAILNQDGNVTDACFLAAIAALQNTTLPPIVVHDGRVFSLDNDQQRKQLPESMTTFPLKQLVLPIIPLPLTMGVITRVASTLPIITKTEDPENAAPQLPPKQHWLVDPSRDEEMVCDGSITVVVDGLQLDNVISLDYQGKVSITHAELALALRMAKGRAQELLPLHCSIVRQQDDS
jgi:exosome complex RNA-binding protein Rrp42 (RNase PH superfamily)